MRINWVATIALLAAIAGFGILLGQMLAEVLTINGLSLVGYLLLGGGAIVYIFRRDERPEHRDIRRTERRR